ncbi:hypothetical protein LTR53_000243 [Teratosphaeriaceae sp. CCFEE 6253]|nr:hypothetical protein LTR53_000243 [Teratosphaeriaceae sp. CCFEE 6253]
MPAHRRRLMDSRMAPTNGTRPSIPKTARKPLASRFAAEEDLLPFEQLARMLKGLKLDPTMRGLPIASPTSQVITEVTAESASAHPSLTVARCPTLDALDDVATRFDQEMLPHLQSLLPRSTVDRIMSGGNSDTDKVDRHSTAQLQFLAYAMTNNLPGISQNMPLISIYRYLKEPVSAFFGHRPGALSVRSAPASLLYAKPLAESSFRGAIEAGDCEAVYQLLGLPELELDVNNHVCMVEGRAYTTVERAATHYDVSMVKMLIDAGADVNKSSQKRRTEDRGSHDYYPIYQELSREQLPLPSGAVECAIQSYRRASNAGLETIRALWQAGGTFDPDFLLILLTEETADAALLLITARIATEHQVWLASGVFHESLRRLGAAMSSQICVLLARVGIDFDRELSEYPFGHLWEVPLSPPRLLDVAASRGDIHLVQQLRAYGASLTDDTLTAALRSRNLDLVHYLIAQGVPTDCFSQHYRTTPIAQAVTLQDTHTSPLLQDRGCMNDIQEEFRYCALLAAFAGTGETDFLDYLVNLQCSHGRDESILSYALVHAVRADQTAAAITLLKAGASADWRAGSRVLGHDTRSPPDPPDDRTPGSDPWDPLFIAVKNQNAILFRKLLEYNPRVSNDSEVVERAIDWGDTSILDDLGFMGADMAHYLLCCIRQGNSEAAQHLLTLDVPLTSSYLEGASPLAAAASNADTAMTLKLLAHGADTRDPAAFIEAMLHSPSVFEVLLEAHLTARSNRSPNHATAVFLDRVREYQLRASGRDKLLRFKSITPLGVAVCKDHGKDLDTVCKLLQAGVQVDRPAMYHRDEHGAFSETALLLAVGSGERAMVELFLDYGADVNFPARRGIKRTPLQKAAELGVCGIVELLLSRKAEVNAAPAERGGGTALQLAAKGGNFGIVQLLLDAGADVLAPGSVALGRTALEAAAENGRTALAEFLSRQARHEDSQYESAIKLAKANSHHAVAELLQRLRIESQTQLATVRRHVCTICNTALSNAFALRRHCETVHGDANDEPSYTCDQCDQHFPRKDTLDRHVATHTGSGRAACSHCGKSVCRKDYLAHHERQCERTRLPSRGD